MMALFGDGGRRELEKKAKAEKKKKADKTDKAGDPIVAPPAGAATPALTAGGSVNQVWVTGAPAGRSRMASTSGAASAR